jgi:hypothetical protein
MLANVVASGMLGTTSSMMQARLLAVALATLVVTPASARNLALLVAVTNDVILIWRELKRRGFRGADMTVLPDFSFESIR